MSYAVSQLARDSVQWFANDKSRNSLVGIKVDNGSIRGIYPCKIDFSYPISSFVGENGSGKSTLLALSACAFHNDDTFHQFARKKSYFTYGDFFTFSPTEAGLQGIEITYTVRQRDGDISNRRRKKPSGKWNDFNTRKYRNVVYLGINRIVPPSESSAHRSYRRAFEAEEIPNDVLNHIKDLAGRIFGKNYSSLRILSHHSYRLFLVERNDISYSGFNMGAGENAVISILLELLLAGAGTLLVIDEIELGLHAKAQKEFITVLKEICRSNKCQVICSTHSDIILSALPPEARFFVQNQGTQTNITCGISAEYAFGKLSGENTHELAIFVEDEVGKSIIANTLPLRLRERVEIYTIGSDQAILKQIAARYRENKLNFIAFLDGDKRTECEAQIHQIKKHLETRIDNEDSFQTIIQSRLCYVPGATWPEKSIIQFLLAAPDLNDLVARWDIPSEDITAFLETALTAGKHNEFFSLAKSLSLDENSVRNDCVKCFKSKYPDECRYICEPVETIINSL